MKCMYCGAELTGASNCPNCSADVRVYKKIIMASNYYYNQGLSRAKVRDLSGAVESLKTSLCYNKLNTQARNLLGLIYYEVGETVDALSEWVISRNFQSEENDAERYLAEIQKNPARLEVINQTIKKYNQALTYCRQDSLDLALLQLKKVLSLNPKLVKGHQLLALLYIKEGKYDAARKSLRAAAKIDAGNTRTQRYLKEVNKGLRADSKGKKPVRNDGLIEYKSGNDTIIQPTHFKDNSALSTIVNIIVGVAIGACVTGFLIVPGVRHAAQNEAKAAESKANDTIATKNQTIQSLEAQIDELTEQIGTVEDKTKENESQVASYEELVNAYAANAAGDVVAAGESLKNVKTEYLSTASKAAYDSINAVVNTQFIQTAYEEGSQAYNQRNYTVAAEKLQEVVDADEKYSDGYALYNLAQSYRNLGDNEKAAIYYAKMVELYPGTERAANSQQYLDAFNATQPPADTAAQQPVDQQPADQTADQQPADQTAEQPPADADQAVPEGADPVTPEQ